MSKANKTPTYGSKAAEQRKAGTARAAARYILVDASGKDLALTAGRARAGFGMQKSNLADARRAVRAQRVATSQAMAEREVRRRFLAREREHERGIRAYWAFLRAKVRVPLRRRASGKKKTAGLKMKLLGQYYLPTYSGPVSDAKGRRGVFMSVEYVGARRSRFGAARRMIVYITRDDGVEHDDTGMPVIMSNVGDTAEEQAMAFELVEVLNRSARGNGKLFFTMIINLPHDVDVETRRAIVEQFCEEAFGAFDIPYCAALHEPSQEGDQRNKHAHIVFALRPLRRTGDHEWEAGRELLTEHDNRERFGHYRELFAQIMTGAVQGAGKLREYTHLSNAARGLKAQAQEKLGARDTKLVRQGETVAKNERNQDRVRQSESFMAQDRSYRRQARGKARQAALRDVQAASPPYAAPSAMTIASSSSPPAPPDLAAAQAVTSASRFPSASAAPMRVRTGGTPPAPLRYSREVRVRPVPPVARPSSPAALTRGGLPPAPAKQPLVRIPAPLPPASIVGPSRSISPAPGCSLTSSVPVKAQTKLPAAPLPTAPVEASARQLELLELFARKQEELTLKRKKKAELMRQQSIAGRGHSL